MTRAITPWSRSVAQDRCTPRGSRLAAELEIRRVLVPRNPGILCAMGLLLADLRADFAATRLLALSSAGVSPWP